MQDLWLKPTDSGIGGRQKACEVKLTVVQILAESEFFLFKKMKIRNANFPSFYVVWSFGKKDFPRWFSASLSSDEIVVVEFYEY